MYECIKNMCMYAIDTFGTFYVPGMHTARYLYTNTVYLVLVHGRDIRYICMCTWYQ